MTVKTLTLILQLIALLVKGVQTGVRKKKDEEISADPDSAWESKFGKLQQPDDSDSAKSEVRSSSGSSTESGRRDKDS